MFLYNWVYFRRQQTKKETVYSDWSYSRAWSSHMTTATENRLDAYSLELTIVHLFSVYKLHYPHGQLMSYKSKMSL